MMGRRRKLLDDLCRDESGTTLVELAIVLPVFLLLFLGLIDFGRLGQEYVMAEKAMQLAARTAVVRPAACAGSRRSIPICRAAASWSSSTRAP